MINFILLVSRQGKTRLTKWFVQMGNKEKTRAVNTNQYCFYYF
jgi:hypothetical protein